MNKTISNRFPEKLFSFFAGKHHSKSKGRTVNNLAEAMLNTEYEIKDVVQDNREIVNFLFTLGCFKGESVTLISVLSDTYVISVKDARYSIDANLAKMILLV